MQMSTRVRRLGIMAGLTTGLATGLATGLTTLMAMGSGIAIAQPEAKSEPTPATSQTAPVVKARTAAAGRAELAIALQRFERQWAKGRGTPEQVVAVNKAFDGLTVAFFMGNFSGAVKRLNGLLAECGVATTSRDEQLAASLRVRMTPMVWLTGEPAAGSAAPQLVARSMYTLDRTGEAAEAVVDLRLGLRASDDSAPVWMFTGPWNTAEPLVVDQAVGAECVKALSPGVWQVVAAVGPSAPVWIMNWQVADAGVLRSAQSARSAGASSDAAEPGDDAGGVRPPTPLSTLQSRAATIETDYDLNQTGLLLRDLNSAAVSVVSESQQVKAGGNPYAHRAGDWSQRVSVPGKQGTSFPLRIVCPPAMAEASKRGDKIALVVALHGAGGDENMFIEAYGAGEIVRLATARGFIVASPRTEQVSDAAAFAAMLAAIKRDYTLDEDRIYVLGHSMGAMAAAALAAREASRIAAAACIAGGFNAAPKSTPAPTLVIGAELDSIVGPARLKKVAEAAAAAGQPVSYEAVTGYGHTLVVEHSLPRALEFLFAHNRGEAAPQKPADDAMPVAPAAK